MTPTGAGPIRVRSINVSILQYHGPVLTILPDGTNCYDGNKWTSACSSNEDCAQNCALEGADYSGTYGITTSNDALTLKFVQEHAYGTNIGSRTYLLNSESKYEMFNLIGNELAFDVDLSTVECGLNSALYFVAMEEDGGMASYPNNKAGAKYGTGYCDSQCARDLKYIGGLVSHPDFLSRGSRTNLSIHYRPTLRAGSLLRVMRTLVSDSAVPAVLRSISGSPTLTPSL